MLLLEDKCHHSLLVSKKIEHGLVSDELENDRTLHTQIQHICTLFHWRDFYSTHARYHGKACSQFLQLEYSYINIRNDAYWSWEYLMLIFYIERERERDDDDDI